MSDLPFFQFTTQEDWHWEIPFENGDSNNAPLPLENAQGQPRVFEALITPARAGARVGEVVATLKMAPGGSGLSFGDGTRTSLVFDIPLSVTKDFPTGEYTADILEIVGASRRLFCPVRITYQEPSAVRSFLRRMLGVTWSASRQPIVTPVAIAGLKGDRGNTIHYLTAPPANSFGVDGDFYFLEQASAGVPRQMGGPKLNGVWPSTRWPIQIPGARKEVRNSPYVGLQTDTEIAVMELDQPRAIYLPEAERFPLAQDLVIMDLSGQVSDAKPVYVMPKTPTDGDTKDMIVGVEGDQLVFTTPYFMLRLRRGGPNQWIRQK